MVSLGPGLRRSPGANGHRTLSDSATVHSVFILLGLIVVVFFVTHLLGDPARLMLRPEATDEQVEAAARIAWSERSDASCSSGGSSAISPAATSAIRSGNACRRWRSCSIGCRPRFIWPAPHSGVAIPLAVILGIISAIRPRSMADRFVTVFSLAGVSTADFWLGTDADPALCGRAGLGADLGVRRRQLRDPARRRAGASARSAASARSCAAPCSMR